MKLLKKIFILAVSILMVGTACVKPDGPGNNPTPDKPVNWDPTAGEVDVINGTTIASGNNLCGWIYDPATNTGIAGVPVTDGYTYTVTDANGVYQMKANDRCRKVYYSTPSNCQIMTDANGVPDFYSKKELKNLNKVQRYDFHLTPAPVVENFTAVMIGDPQCCNSTEAGRYKNETVKDIQKTLSDSRYKSPVAVTLGDVTFDSNSTYDYMKASMQKVTLSDGSFLPFMQCMGNHDHNALAVVDTDSRTDMQYKAQDLYFSNFGPCDYSFNKGKVHFVIMDDVWVYGRGTSSKSNGFTCKYYSGLSDEQFEWLKADLNTVADKENTMVIFCAHIPFRGGGSSTTGSNFNTDKKYAEVLKQLAQFHEAHIMIGHTHYSQNWIHSNYKTKGGNAIYEHVHGAACGAWWKNHSDVIGGPNSFTIYEIEGNEMVDWVYKGTNRNADFQFRVYNGNKVYPGTPSNNVPDFKWYETEKFTRTDAITLVGNAQTKNAFVAQVWNDDDTFWKLEFWQNGKKVGDFTRLANGSQANKAIASYWYNVANLKTDTYSNKTASHYWVFKHPNASKVNNWDPDLEMDWEVKAIQTLPNGKTHTYSCNQLTSDNDTFLKAISF